MAKNTTSIMEHNVTVVILIPSKLLCEYISVALKR